MASKTAPARSVKKPHYPQFRRLIAGLCLLCTVVVAAAGIMYRVRMSTVIYRAGLVNFVILTIGWIIVKVMASYEEMNSGQA
jgi:hypothetical protein